jgi:TRAP-type C4-dicarboxylate transport system substrate-binding protein
VSPRCRLAAAALALLTGLVAASARAEPVTLRMAAIAPEGTEWARAMKAFAADVETASKGELRIKWYLSGMAGDELQALERVRHGQLDGEAGAIFCQQLAPSVRIARIAGLYRSREEAIYVLARLKPMLDEEFRKSGFTNLGQAVFGGDLLFSRQPIHSMSELKGTRMWAWNLDPVWQMMATEMGMRTTVTSIEEHSPAWHRNQYDAFFTEPSAALAYQWSTDAKYIHDLAATILPGCMVVANTAIDPLPTESKRVLIAASTTFLHRFNAVCARLGDLLAGGLFEKQGLTKIAVSQQFREDFMTSAKRARDKLGASLISPALLGSVEKMLEEYRAQHRREAARR